MTVKPATPRIKPRFTSNCMGWASEQLSPLSELFVEYCAQGNCGAASPAVDIGAAFGLASLSALRAGAFVVANDIDTAPLKELEERASADELARLTIRAGRFPVEVSFDECSIGAIHASNVFHFFNGKQLELAFRIAFRWLKANGKLFVQAATPFQTPFQAFIPEYERRVEMGEQWPGWVPKIRAWSRHRQLGRMPPSVHLLDDMVLERTARAAGFEVERCWMYSRPDLARELRLDGRESVGLVARRPAAPVESV